MGKRITRAAGIDTGKHTLNIAIYPSGERLEVDNTETGHRELIAWLRKRRIRRVGIEASGNYEQAVIACLRRKGFEVAHLQPRQVKAFAIYKLQRAKNDRIDAALIAECTAGLDTVRKPTDARFVALAEHLLVIEQIEADLVRLTTRRERYTDKRFLRQSAKDIERLKARLKAELALLLADVRCHADLAARLELIETVDGIGRRTALALLILLPELGTLDRQRIASLGGVAPFDDDSGEHTGERHIGGGRARVRRALYNAALPAAFRWNDNLVEFYGRLSARNKPHKEALIACVRKLLIYVNAVCQRGTPWTTSRPVQMLAA